MQAQPLRLTPSLMAGGCKAVSLRAGVDAIVMGAWWLLREIELAGLRRMDCVWAGGAGCASMTLELAASKTDATAKGVKRTLAGACPSALCPVAAAKRVLATTAGQKAEAFVIVNAAGRPATKDEVVAEVREVAKQSGTEGHVTGHSMRVTGAQRLAYAGISETRIMTFGRWASQAFRLYVREAVLGANGGDMARVVEGNAASMAVNKVVEQSVMQGQAVSALAREDFTSKMSESPTHPWTEVDVHARWTKFSEELAMEVKEAAERPLPRFCMSEGGICT